MVPSSSSSRRPQRLIGDPVVLHAQSEAVRRRHHGAGPRLHSHHGNPSQTTHLRPQWILYLQVHPDCVYTKQIIYIIYGCCMNNSARIPASFGLKRKKILTFLKSISPSFCSFLGFASRRDLYICIPAAHPPGGPWGEDSFGEGRQRAGGGPGGPAFQYTLSGEHLHPEESQLLYKVHLQKKKQTKSCMNFFFCTF